MSDNQIQTVQKKYNYVLSPPIKKGNKTIFKKIYFNNIIDLAKKLNITKDQAKAKKIQSGKTELKTVSQIKFKGRNVYFRNQTELASKLKISSENAKNLISEYKEGKTKRYLQNKKGEIGKYNLKDKPIVFQKFGIKSVNNERLLEGKIKDVNIYTGGYKGNVKVMVDVKVAIEFSPPKQEIKQFEKIVTINSNKITKNEMISIIADHYQQPPTNIVRIDKFEVVSTLTGEKQTITNMELRQSNPISIGEIFNEVIDVKNGNCIQTYLGDIYKKFSKKELLGLHTTNDLYDYCVKHRIKMIAYDINGNIIKQYKPDHHNKSRKNLIFVAYNNHIYPLKNAVLNKNVRSKIYNKAINIENVKDKLIEFLELGILPAKINCFKNKVKSIIVNNTFYFSNPEYDICKSILKKFGIEDRMRYSTNLTTIGDIISKLYTSNHKSLKSFIPIHNKFVKGPINYYNDEYDEYETNTHNIYTIDKNKAHSYALTQLDFLIQVDFKSCNIRKGNIKHDEIIPHYWYIVDPVYSSNLLDNLSVYDGQHLLYCIKEGLDFKILEEIETIKHPNLYKQMVLDIYSKVESKYAKQIVNIFIGKLERHNGLVDSEKFIKVCNKDEADTFSGYKTELNDDYVICSEPDITFDIFTQKPITFQIKDYVKRCMYKKLKELCIKPTDIIQMKTDSITFRSNTFKNNKTFNDNLDGWKFEHFKKFKPSIPVKNEMTFILPKLTENICYQQYAGGGKTYNIVNNEIPKTNDYIILSPSHISISEYRKHNFNCDVIQAYTLTNRIPKEQNIIIDEYGMLDASSWNLIYKCILLNKSIKCWGDSKQLLPVGSNKSYNIDNWLNYCFKEINTDWINRRNKFTKKEYDNLIDQNCNVRKQVKKYSKEKFEDAEVIIVHRNKTRHQYNSYMCDYLGIKSKTDIGCKLICLTNDLRKYNIYNKYCFIVKEIKNNKIVLYNEEFNLELELTEEEINKNFDYSYARTIYNIQGQTLNSYYWTDEDNYFLDGRMAYTIISRLRF